MGNKEFLDELLNRSADGAYVVDEQHRIVAWNDAAEELLGFSAQDVVGHPCHQILGGHSEGGCAVCRRDCLPLTASQRGQLVPSFDVQVRTASGHARWVNVSIIAIPIEEEDGSASVTVVHLCRDIEAKKQSEIFAREIVSRAGQLKLQPLDLQTEDRPPATALTKREYQVLDLLSQGADTGTIATQLVIGRPTVRNHIQRILHKLGVHSRLEAVTYAREHHLLD